ncbi:hypothetical protein F4001_09030 [Candidatus Poribacteria bacterium]|nr:hypothetical protein [Candidatus Poribacteria bacterium]
MTNLKRILTLFIGTTIILVGCGNIKPGHKIYRVNESLLVFLSMGNKSRIVDTTFENRELYVDIRTGKQTEERVISLKEQFKLEIVKPHETVRIEGTDRLNGYGVVKLKVTPPVNGKMSMHVNWTGLKVQVIQKRQGDFPNSGTYRVGDRITAYCYLTETKVPAFKTTKFGLKTHLKQQAVFKGREYTVKDHIVKNVLINDPDIVLNQHISIMLDDLKTHEYAEVEDKKKIGDDVLVVNFKVSEKITQQSRTFRNRNRSYNRPNLEDR